MEETMKQVKQFLDYCASQVPTILTYHKSGIVLSGHSNAEYLNKDNI